MNEHVARDVVLARAVETADTGREILSDDDRMYASRSARELAQWQAADSKSPVTSAHFLQQRAEQLLKRLGERHPAFAAFAQRRGVGGAFSVALPLAALLLGAGLDRITDPHRVDLLSAPLLAIVGWNLLVYLGLFAWLFIPEKEGVAPRGLLRHLGAGKAAVPRKLPRVLADALARFIVEWGQLSAPLTRARIARTFHLAAAMFALGAVLSLYARGLLSQYAAGWESTFLDAAQLHSVLSFVFAPARAVFGLPGFSVADIEALRLAPSAGALWVHLYAATVALLVLLPRLVLAGVAHWQVRRLAADFPLDLGGPYFRKLGDQSGTAAPGVLRVLPYSYTLDEARQKNLAALATALLGEQARVMLRPVSGYGEEAVDALRGTALDDPAVTMTAVLFNLSATPEKENHGAFLEHLVRHSARGVCVLVDESGFVERMGAGDQRLAERIALWQQFCAFHRAPATIVNLADPGRRPFDAAGPVISRAP
jgi:hypothetical protein